MSESCESDADCDDGIFCNGQETCRETVNGFSCFYTVTPCSAEQTCDESAAECETDCDVTLDADGDGSLAAECGGDDCDDDDVSRFPGNTEVCDSEGHDEDCDPCTVAQGTGDDGDSDRDGFVSTECSNTFDPNGAIPSCPGDRLDVDGIAGILSGRDCNDEDSSVRPGANETCNGIDDDCDGELDDGLRQTNYYPDCDGDGQGDAESEATPACAIPADAPDVCENGRWEEDDNRDCDDSNAAIFVGAPELSCAQHGRPPRGESPRES